MLFALANCSLYNLYAALIVFDVIEINKKADVINEWNIVEAKKGIVLMTQIAIDYCYCDVWCASC